MKKKIIISITTLLMLGLAIAAYSVTKSSTKIADASSCCAMKDCCKDGKCSMNNGGKCNCAEMHKKDGVNAKHECNADCCKDGKCTMSADGKCNCNDACCKDSKCSMNSECCKDGVCKMGCCKDGKCEMHKKDGDSNASKGDCCKGKDSCQMHKGENKDKPKDN